MAEKTSTGSSSSVSSTSSSSKQERQVPEPPWKKYPEPPTSMRWRMGVGEDYVSLWFKFWKDLSSGERTAYFKQYPPPSAWEKWSKHVLDDIPVSR